MIRSVLVFIICMIVGSFVISLPDTGPRLYSFSEAHGPSIIDFIGIVVLLTGWTVLMTGLWKRRDQIFIYNGSKLFIICIFMIGFGSGLIVASVVSDFPYWWVLGAIILLIIQFMIVYYVSMTKTNTSKENNSKGL